MSRVGYLTSTFTFLDYYCSGGEGIVTEQIERELNRLGWKKRLC
jgi:hypothetical protein